MTTIYIPRLIESAGQAEALPEGTVALALPGQPVGSIAHRCGCGDRSCRWLEEGRGRTSKRVVGWTALVPIEAEEQTTGALVNRVGEILWEESTRYVTPWEEA